MGVRFEIVGDMLLSYWDDGEQKVADLELAADLTRIVAKHTNKFNPDQERGPDGRWGSGGGDQRASMWTPAMQERAAYAQDTIAKAGGMNGPNSTKAQNTLSDGKTYTSERREMHQAWVNQQLQAARDRGVPADRQAIVAAGLPGAGKTEFLSGRVPIHDENGNEVSTADVLGVNPDHYVSVNPDDAKEFLAGNGHAPTVGDLSPMETAALMHVESADMSAMLDEQARAAGLNVMYDATLKTADNARSTLSNLAASGYDKPKGVLIDVTVKQSLDSAHNRYAKGQDAYNKGRGLGGRLVPDSVINGMRTKSGLNSLPADNFRLLANQGAFSNAVAIRNPGRGNGHATIQFRA